MTIEEAIAYFIKTNEGIILAAKDANVYDYENQQIKAICMRRTFEANKMAIASLETWNKIKQEINDLFSKPACYMPNYDAYKMFLEIIDKHLQEVEE